ncbi:MAG: hypothetical protein ABWZ42_01435 [Ilumatobacteraceae bacterium]
MEPVGSTSTDSTLPPPVVPDPVLAPGTSHAPGTPHAPGTMVLPQFPRPTDASTPGQRPAAIPSVHLRALLPWRILATSSIIVVFGVSGWQVHRVHDGALRSLPVMLLSIVAGVVAAIAVLVWTYSATENARRLIAPALTNDPPDPWRAVSAWALPMLFAASASAVVVGLSSALNTPDENPSSIPLAVAVLSLLLSVPFVYWPFRYLSRVVRQIGGHSADLARWMWVPVVLAVVGVATVAGLRIGGAVDPTGELAPMWVVAVVAVAPCVIVVLLGWRAAGSVEEAISLAAARRVGVPRIVAPPTGHAPSEAFATGPAGPPSSRRRISSSADMRGAVRQIPGTDALRFAVVVGLAGLALLAVVGAAVMVLFVLETRDGIVLPSQTDRAWETVDRLYGAARIVGLAVTVLAALWTLVAVSNVRLATGARRNPLLAAAAWPASFVAVWVLAGRIDDHSSVGRVVLTLLAQAAVLYVPFLLLERTAGSAGARRTPLRITYVFTVVLLVHVQGLVTLSDSTDTVTSFEFGRLAGYLGLGALVLLLSTLAVTEACRSITGAARYEADMHNALVEQRRAV